MRFEQRICDRCGASSGPPARVREPERSGLIRVLSMEQRGWGLVDGQDCCPDCMWMLELKAAA